MENEKGYSVKEGVVYKNGNRVGYIGSSYNLVNGKDERIIYFFSDEEQKRYDSGFHFQKDAIKFINDTGELWKFAKGGKVKRSSRELLADKTFKASPSGSRKSKKYATIELANGTKFRRRNANQTGDVEGGIVYSEKRPNRTDRKGSSKPTQSTQRKSRSTRTTRTRTRRTPNTTAPNTTAKAPVTSNTLRFLGVEFKRYNYTIGGL